MLTVTWNGPDARSDLITIAEVRCQAPPVFRLPLRSPWLTNPAKSPQETGRYELRYVLRGKKILHSQTLLVTEAE